MHHPQEKSLGSFTAEQAAVNGSSLAMPTHLAARAAMRGAPLPYTWSTYSYIFSSGRHIVEVPPIPVLPNAQGAGGVEHVLHDASKEQKQPEEGDGGQTPKKYAGGVKVGLSNEGQEGGEAIVSSEVPHEEGDSLVQGGDESKEDVTRDSAAPSSFSSAAQAGTRAEAEQGSDDAAGGLHKTQASAEGGEEGLSRGVGTEAGSDVTIVLAKTASRSSPLPQKAPQKEHQGDEGEVFACDRSSWRADVCRMRGDVRVKGDSKVLWLFSRNQTVPRGTQKVKPYPRKWEGLTEYCMGTVMELVLRCIDDPTQQQQQEARVASEAGLSRGTGRAQLEQAQQLGTSDADFEGANQAVQSSRRLLSGAPGGGGGALGQGGEEEASHAWGRPAGVGKGAEGGRRRLLKAHSKAHKHHAKLPAEKGLGSSHTKVLRGAKEVWGRVSGMEGSAQLGEWRSDERADWDRSPFMYLGVWPKEWKLRKWLGAWRAKGSMTRWPPGSLKSPPPLTCDVRHRVPAVVISTAGYSGNIYHDFNECLIPLWVTVQQYDREVVLVISDARDWWILRYWELLDQMSNYPPVLLGQDSQVHCFPEATVGATTHDDLAVDSTRMRDHKSIHDFQAMLRRAWESKVTPAVGGGNCSRPQMAIIVRTGARSFTNHKKLARVAEGLGYAVRIIDPAAGVSLADMWGHMQRSAVVIGVHGAAMTHLLFMRPGSFFIQVIPLGLEQPAREFYGLPAMKLGLHYVAYNITMKESTLSRIYPANDPVLTNPGSIVGKGWMSLKGIYLDNQNVTLSKKRVAGVLKRVMKVLASDAPALEQYC
eukprot:jgi/Mesen1/9973/ME000072S09386